MSEKYRWEVSSETTPNKTYVVRREGDGFVCSCSEDRNCKHIKKIKKMLGDRPLTEKEREELKSLADDIIRGVTFKYGTEFQKLLYKASDLMNDVARLDENKVGTEEYNKKMGEFKRRLVNFKRECDNYIERKNYIEREKFHWHIPFLKRKKQRKEKARVDKLKARVDKLYEQTLYKELVKFIENKENMSEEEYEKGLRDFRAKLIKKWQEE